MLTFGYWRKTFRINWYCGTKIFSNDTNDTNESKKDTNDTKTDLDIVFQCQLLYSPRSLISEKASIYAVCRANKRDRKNKKMYIS